MLKNYRKVLLWMEGEGNGAQLITSIGIHINVHTLCIWYLIRSPPSFICQIKSNITEEKP